MSVKFSTKELAKLIKICKNNNVSSITFGEIQLSFGATENPPKTPRPQARGLEKAAKEIEELGRVQEQYNSARAFTESLQLEDPLKYEQMLMDRELIEEENH